MTASDRLAAIDSLPAAELCGHADTALSTLLEVMNEETTLLRAGRWKEAEQVTARKAELAQDYVTLARAVQRQAARLKAEAPELLAQLRAHHESLAAQMAENLRVLATARSVTETILSDVAESVTQASRTRTYGANGAMAQSKPKAAPGLSVNRAL